MAFNEIEMNSSSLKNDIGALDNLIRRLQTQKNRLVGTVHEMNAMWTGQANQAFNAQFTKDMENFDGMLQVLREMLDALENARREYDSCEQRVSSIISNISV